jgi:AsmA-like C-terminal region
MLRRVSIALAVLLLLLTGGVYLAITRGLHGDLVRSTLEAQLAARLGEPVHIGSAGASILPAPALDLRDVAIGRPPSVRLARVRVMTGLRGLLSRRVEDAEIVLDDGSITWPLPFPLTPPRSANAPETPPPFTVQSVRRITLRDITVVTGLPPVVIDLDAALAGDRLEIARLTARSGSTRLEAKGAFESLSRVQARLEVTGNLAFAGYDATDLAAAVAITPQAIVLGPLAFRMFGGKFSRGRLDADLRGATPQVRLTGDVADVDVAALMKAFGSPGTLTGRLGGHVALVASGTDGTALARTSHGTIAATVRDGTFPHLDLVRTIVLAFGKPSGGPPAGSGSAFSSLRGAFALANSTVTTDDLSLASRDFDLSGRGRLQVATGAVDAKADVALSKDLTAQAGTDLRRYAQEDGRVIVPVTIHGTLERPTVFVDVGGAPGTSSAASSRRRKGVAEPREIEDHRRQRRVVVGAASGGNERGHERLHDRGDRRRRAVRDERLVRDAVVLSIQLRAESRLVVPVQDPFTVDLEHAARRESAEQRVAHLRRVDAGLPRQRERLADGDQRAADHHLVAHLADLPGARVADADDAFGIPHGVQDRLHRREGAGVAANHDRQRAAHRADLAAADRRIEQRRAMTARRLGEPPRHGGRDAAAVDQDRARLDRREDAVGPLEHLLHVWRIGQHRDDPHGCRGYGGRGARARRAGGDELVNRSRAAAVHDEAEAPLEEVLRHGLAHEPQSDEANRVRHQSSILYPCRTLDARSCAAQVS